MIQTSRSWLTAATAALLFTVSSAPFAAAQETIGVDVCFCQPSNYVFTLDFALGCDDSDITNETTGVVEAICSDPVGVANDPFPVLISNIIINELDRSGNSINQSNLTGTFLDGDSVEYASVLSEADVPGSVGGLLMSLVGQNAAGDIILNSWAILYTNSCDEYPVLLAGNQIGWTVLVSTGWLFLLSVQSFAVMRISCRFLLH